MNVVLSVLLFFQMAGPARAEDALKTPAAILPEIQRIVSQGADAVRSGATDLSAAGHRALATVRGTRLAEAIDVDAVKAATRRALAQVGTVLSDVDFERLFTEQTKVVVSALVRGELGLSFDELSFGKGPIAMFEGFGTVALACMSNTLSGSVCVAAGGVAVLVGIALIAQALSRAPAVH